MIGQSEFACARRLRIDIVVHGRFHAFALARALIERGHDVRILTNYPKWACSRFGIPKSIVRSFLSHGILARVQNRLFPHRMWGFGVPSIERLFGAWAARNVRSDCDLIYIFSGVAEETLLKFAGKTRPIIWLVRASAHIRTQYELLADEEKRSGVSLLHKPLAWSIAREEREYELAQHISTLSTFAVESFKSRPDLREKAFLLVSGVDLSRFLMNNAALQQRISRIRAGGPLRVLTVGAFSYRKGAIDLVTVAQALQSRMEFRFVGDLASETSNLRATCPDVIELVARVPEIKLREHYAWADIFLFPTIEDGYPAVVAQAQASGLPVITTPNGSGPDVISDGENGWIVPIRDPDAIVAILAECDRDRAKLANMAGACAILDRVRGMEKMAEDLEITYARHVSEAPTQALS